jgi:hypothetical protein
MTEEERKKIKSKTDELAHLLDDLERGEIYPEDLDIEQVKRLMKLLSRNGDVK